MVQRLVIEKKLKFSKTRIKKKNFNSAKIKL